MCIKHIFFISNEVMNNWVPFKSSFSQWNKQNKYSQLIFQIIISDSEPVLQTMTTLFVTLVHKYSMQQMLIGFNGAFWEMLCNVSAN